MSTQPESVAVEAPRLGWRDAMGAFYAQRTHVRILSGSIVMLLGYGLVSAMNFAYNVAVARLLGPAAFGHAAAMITLLMLGSAITLSYQLVCAKFVARAETPQARAAVYRYLMRKAWLVGVAVGSALALGSGALAPLLHLPTPWLTVLLGAGIAFYVPLGVKRGGMQGACEFRRLSLNFVIEAVVKFVGAVTLIHLGLGVLGAVAAISASVALAYLLPLTARELRGPAAGPVQVSFREGMQAIVFFVGQVVINNIDILLVKHFFAPEPAGLYAAVALVGRILYFASWSVVSVMFPVSAGTKRRDESAAVLVLPLVFVLGLSLAFIAGLAYFPGTVLNTVFGPHFHAAVSSVGPLMGLYAAATGVYALAVVLMTYEMSRRIANTSWLQLAFSGLVAAGIVLFHASLRQVILVQLVLMGALFIAVAMPFFRPRPAAALEEAA